MSNISFDDHDGRPQMDTHFASKRRHYALPQSSPPSQSNAGLGSLENINSIELLLRAECEAAEMVQAQLAGLVCLGVLLNCLELVFVFFFSERAAKMKLAKSEAATDVEGNYPLQ